MKDVEWRLIAELVKNSRRSDRELAKAIGVSLATVTRMRKRLETEGYIQEYTMIPDFSKLGYQIMVLTIAKARTTLSLEKQEKAKKLLLAAPQVLFVASAEGMSGNGIMLSLHKNFSDYRNFMRSLQISTGGFMEKVDTMLVSLDKAAVVKSLSITNIIAEEIEQRSKR
ncbi:MAG: Lrp/AsnC family transcriptional regulator [Candidatus Bathyarchaeota archaeon]|nr:MAG: Lrp/AsnC family transcriptional regulator [Candidatus Bathyarchaeota archaeon]